MSWSVLLLLAVITVASRMLPMTLLPTPTGRAAEALRALPAPLFASLFALSLVGEGAPDGRVVAATLGALAGGSRRSLALVLVFGLLGYGVAVTLGV